MRVSVGLCGFPLVSVGLRGVFFVVFRLLEDSFRVACNLQERLCLRVFELVFIY